MTERKWLTSNDSILMLRSYLRRTQIPDYLDGPVRLLTTACCRMVFEDIRYPYYLDVINSTELFALGLMKWNDYEGQRAEARRHFYTELPDRLCWLLNPLFEMPERAYMEFPERTLQLAELARRVAVQSLGSRAAGPAPITASFPTDPWHDAFRVGMTRGEMIMADYVRCIVGNPFHPSLIDPDWRTTTSIAIAEGIDEDRAYDRMPILADALEDAGCDDQRLFGHCRAETHHTRGCWVVERVLDRGNR